MTPAAETVTALVAVFADEVEQIAASLCCSETAAVASLPGVGFPAAVNHALAQIATPHVLITDGGAWFAPGTTQRLVDELSASVWVTSVRIGGQADHRPISPLGFCMETDRLRDLGGLDRRLEAFGYEITLARQLTAAGKAMASPIGADIQLLSTDARNDALGSLYYTQLHDVGIADGTIGEPQAP